MTTSSKRSRAENNNATPPGGVVLSDTNVERFMRLFEGYSKAYGLFDVRKADDSGKMVGSARTARGLADAEVFRKHLDGTGPGLGIIMLRDDDTVRFGAIDYDNKKADHVKAEAMVKKMGLPLVVCRSKSGGIHFYCFTKDPVPAALMRERLSEWTAMLKMAATTEQFPKQSARFNDNDIGSWINLPYFNADATERWAMAEGQVLTLPQFLDAAELARVDPSSMERSSIEDGDKDGLFQEGPPCLQHYAATGGFVEGSRNNGMQAVAVYLRKRFPDDWKTRMDAYNSVMAQLPSAEVQGIVKHNDRKEYNYSCKLPPLNSCCQRKVCLQRMHGVGEGSPDSKGYDINALIRYDSVHGDEPLWGMEVNGIRIMVTNSQFYSRDEFNRQCMAQANVVPCHMPPQRWLKYLSEIIGTAEVVKLPEDASPKGQLWHWVENFCNQNVHALEKEAVWLGQSYREEGVVYFRSHYLFKYLDRNRVEYDSEQQVYMLLRDHKADTYGWNLKGRFINVWGVPMEEPIRLEEEFSIPGLAAPGEDF